MEVEYRVTCTNKVTLWLFYYSCEKRMPQVAQRSCSITVQEGQIPCLAPSSPQCPASRETHTGAEGDSPKVFTSGKAKTLKSSSAICSRKYIWLRMPRGHAWESE